MSQSHTAQKMKFSIKDFFSKCNQIRSFRRLWLLMYTKPAKISPHMSGIFKLSSEKLIN